MRQKEVLEKLGKEIRDLHHIEIKNHHFHYHGGISAGYIGFPTSLIKKIDENGITVHITLQEGVLTLWKTGPPPHLSLFDRKARNRRLAKQRRERGKKKEVKS
ncbi:hypothetical protein KAR91_21740 [Candidatus Pacearchaeota archaeon]|nr:hypothetical protein [Candidatus Pacearchaeota archaeon]